MFFNWLLSEAAGFPLVDGKARAEPICCGLLVDHFMPAARLKSVAAGCAGWACDLQLFLGRECAQSGH